MRSLVLVVAACGMSAHARAQGVDFIGDAKLLYRIAACGGGDTVDNKLTKVVESPFVTHLSYEVER